VGDPGSGARAGTRPSGDTGAGLTEYAGVVLLVAAIAGVVLVAGVPDRVGALLDTAVCRVAGDAACADAPGGDTAASGGEDGDGGGLTTLQYPVDDGGSEVCSPLCEPSPGAMSLVEWPSPPMHPETATALESAEEYDSKDIGEVSGCDFWTLCIDHQIQREYRDVRMYANGGALRGQPNASDALHHFLDGSGETLEIDVDDLVADVPEFQREIEGAHRDIGRRAIADAKAQGVDGPVTYPVSTEWNSFGFNGTSTGTGTGYVYDNEDWINTLGSWNYQHTGEVRVYPPEEPGGEWRYEVSAATNVQKYYDWDEDRTTPAVGSPIPSSFSEQDLWNMHRAGMGQEFWTEGSHTSTSEGTAP
jgi:hypothetical protein